MEVFVVSFPISPVYLFSPNKTQYLHRKKFSNGFVEVENNIQVFVPNAIIPPIPEIVRYLPFVLHHWYRLTFPNIGKTIHEAIGSSAEIILSDSVFFPFIPKFIEPKAFIFRVPDFLSGFWASNKALLESESRLLHNADLVVTSSRLLQLDLSQTQQIDAKFLSNGVESSRFEKEMDIPEEYIKSKKPKAIYIGALKIWFDLELLTYLAEAKPEWDFYIIGDQDNLAYLPKVANIYFLGEKSQAECVPYLQHATTGIIPFQLDTNDLVNHINPIKLYEYLAVGIPVVSTHWKELELIDAPIFLADSPESFVSMLEDSLSSSPQDRDQRKLFADKFTWDSIASSLLEML